MHFHATMIQIEEAFKNMQFMQTLAWIAHDLYTAEPR